MTIPPDQPLHNFLSFATNIKYYADQQGTYSSSDGDFSGWGDTLSPTGQASIRFMSMGKHYSVTLQAPANNRLYPGTYTNAATSISGAAGKPAVEFSGPGLRCEKIKAQFTIKAIVFDRLNKLQHLDATFEYHCDQDGSAIAGRLRFDQRKAESELNIIKGKVE